VLLWLGGGAEYPPTEEGEDAALGEWERSHARPLLARQIPSDVAADLAALRSEPSARLDSVGPAGLRLARRRKPLRRPPSNAMGEQRESAGSYERDPSRKVIATGYARDA
jgi:hypothetical protein